MDNNNQGMNDPQRNYSSPESYDPDAQYGFPPQGNYQTVNDAAGNSGNMNQMYNTNTGGSYNGSMNNGNNGYNGNNDYNAGNPYNNGNPPFTNQPNMGMNNAYNYGNGNYYTTMNAGQPPVNKNGQPIQNYFGMKLTFTILEMVASLIMLLVWSWCFGLIALILSIIACVLVCIQNSNYKANRWNQFNGKRKASTVLLWVTFGCLILFTLLVGLIRLSGLTDYAGNSKIDKKDYRSVLGGDSADDILNEESDDLSDNDGDEGNSSYSSPEVNVTDGKKVPYVEDFNTFKFNDHEITLPLDVSEMEKSGLHFDAKDEEQKIEENSYYGYSIYDSNENYRGTAFVYNDTDKKILVKDGIVGAIVIDSYGNDDLELLGGIRFGDSIEKCIDVFGKDVTKESENYGNVTYDWYFEDEGYYTSIELSFIGGTLQDVWITNTAGLQN